MGKLIIFLLIAGTTMVSYGFYSHYKRIKAKEVAICEEYGYDLAKTVDYHKYCGFVDSKGHQHWQKLSYIKRKGAR